MEIKGIKWLGICTQDWNNTLHFFGDVLGLTVRSESKLSIVKDRQVRCAELMATGGDFVEVFDQNLPERDLFTTPVIGLLVGDVTIARDELDKKGVSFIGPICRGTDWVWSYFRSPDGHVPQLMSDIGLSISEV
jgi:predicted enzyme related to lactoylglutathione lyase